MPIIRRDDGDRIMPAGDASTCRGCGADLSGYVTQNNPSPDCCGQCANMLNRKTQRHQRIFAKTDWWSERKS